MPQSHQRLELLAEVAGRLLVSENPQSLVEELCTKVMSFLDCQAFFNFLTDEEKKSLHLNACFGIPPKAALETEWLDLGVAVCGCVAQQGQRIIAHHIQTGNDPRTTLVKSFGIQAYACHPLLTTGGKVIGTLSFGSKTRETFSDDDLSLMKAVADQVAIAMERIRLLESERRQRQALEELTGTLEQRVAERTTQVQELANRLRALTVELSQAEQSERRRIATVLHEHIQQVLVASRMQLAVARRQATDTAVSPFLDEADRYIKEALSASRSLGVELSPPVLHDVGLAAGLNWLAGQMRDDHGLLVELVTDHAGEPESEAIRLFLYHAVRELLLNVVKHSETRHARITMTGDGASARIEVEDHGRGFDPAVLETRQPSVGKFGLFSIHERISHLGGSMRVQSAPGGGARIVLKAPVALDGEALAPIPSAPQVLFGTSPPEQKSVQGKIRVLLADDHKIVRQGLISMLKCEPDIEVIGEAADGRQAFDLARELRPDVVIMDVSMPVLDGIEATRLIHHQAPDIDIVGLSMHESRDVAAAMMQAGAKTYLTKGGPSEDLTGAIRRCRSGAAFVGEGS